MSEDIIVKVWDVESFCNDSETTFWVSKHREIEGEIVAYRGGILYERKLGFREVGAIWNNPYYERLEE